MVATTTGRALLLDLTEPCYFPGDEFDPGPNAAWVYRPKVGKFRRTSSLDKPRFGFVMTPLPGGRVLVAGGRNEHGGPKPSTRIWSSTTGKWTEGPLMTIARDEPVAAVLLDGRVMVAGGMTPSGVYTNKAEIYDPASDRWTPTGPLGSDNSVARALTLSDGRVLALGSELDMPAVLAWLYDPASGTWATLDDAPPGLLGASPVALDDGTALFVGGSPKVVRFDPENGWSSAGRLTTNRKGASATLLGDGRVLVAGGHVGGFDGPTPRVFKSAELFDPTTGRSSKAASMPLVRDGGIGTLLEDGSVLIAGGVTDVNPGDTPWCSTPQGRAVRWVP